MDKFNYAHRDTSGTARWNAPTIPERLQNIRRKAFDREIPIASDDALQFLICQTAALRPERILEIGTATGCSALAMHYACPSAKIITVEHNADFCREALKNVKDCGAEGSITVVFGEADDVIKRLAPPFDMIFLDCAKAQYIKLLPALKLMLSCGGMLIADDVLLYGWASGEAEVPPKRKMLARHIEEYLKAVTTDPTLTTCVVRAGDGMAVSVKKFS